MATEVLSGLWQLRVPIPDNPLGWVLPYLIRSDDGYTLIDAGWNTQEAFDALDQELHDAGVTFSDIKRLIVTHVHPDHYGLAGRVKEVSGCRIVIHQRERDFIRTRYRNPDQLLERVMTWLNENGVPRDEIEALQSSAMPVRGFVVPVDPDAVLWGGETINLGLYRFEVYWTPGHSPGHICFYDRAQRIILTGDHVLPTITPNVGMHPQQTGNPLGDYMASLQRLEPLQVDDVLPAHEHSFKDLQGRLKGIVDHHHERLDQMIDIIGSDRKTAYEVASTLIWSIGTFDKFSTWLRRAAISETLAHLEYAVYEGRLATHRQDGIIRYERATTSSK